MGFHWPVTWHLYYWWDPVYNGSGRDIKSLVAICSVSSFLVEGAPLPLVASLGIPSHGFRFLEVRLVLDLGEELVDWFFENQVNPLPFSDSIVYRILLPFDKWSLTPGKCSGGLSSLPDTVLQLGKHLDLGHEGGLLLFATGGANYRTRWDDFAYGRHLAAIEFGSHISFLVPLGIEHVAEIHLGFRSLGGLSPLTCHHSLVVSSAIQAYLCFMAPLSRPSRGGRVGSLFQLAWHNNFGRFHQSAINHDLRQFGQLPLCGGCQKVLWRASYPLSFDIPRERCLLLPLAQASSAVVVPRSLNRGISGVMKALDRAALVFGNIRTELDARLC
ncbi:hypothetical protein Acr_00g0037910 [Actinidia rufa]|uniref:Uncharacterized protein n=1 Tax=Actinidia rufa TaxID=165716 RepID=A0A7J0DH06_9ERIC|nr:hypothetical protein Acr_00g0037910 [Actinidia rufa]